ncbi:MAG: hypothetical protein Q8Q31_02160 [Nanoarchaeota archaeon]|nr:hypothetical protein [Nanoarchaeota archaeon]
MKQSMNKVIVLTFLFAITLGFLSSSVLAEAIYLNAPRTISGSALSTSSSESTVLGNGASAAGQYSTALGSQSVSHKPYSISLGRQAWSLGEYSTALGSNSIAESEFSTALGSNSYAKNYATALGSFSNASGPLSTAVGRRSSALGLYSTAVGYIANANKTGSTALGYTSTASSTYSTAIGPFSLASGPTSTAIGPSANALGESSFAVGHSSIASGDNSYTFGKYVTALKEGSFVIGQGQNNIKKLVNNIPNSLIIGFSADPTLFVNGSSIGISTVNPSASLDVNGNTKVNGRLDIIGNTETAQQGLSIIGTTSSLSPNTDSSTLLYLSSGGVTTAVFDGSDGEGAKIAFQEVGSDDFYLYLDKSQVGLESTKIWSVLSAPIIFGTANTERMRIESDGKVGIGIANPRTTLDVNGLMRLVPLEEPPSCNSYIEGSIYYNKREKKHFACNGESWNDLYPSRKVSESKPKNEERISAPSSEPQPVASKPIVRSLSRKI